MGRSISVGVKWSIFNMATGVVVSISRGNRVCDQFCEIAVRWGILYVSAWNARLRSDGCRYGKVKRNGTDTG